MWANSWLNEEQAAFQKDSSPWVSYNILNSHKVWAKVLLKTLPLNRGVHTCRFSVPAWLGRVWSGHFWFLKHITCFVATKVTSWVCWLLWCHQQFHYLHSHVGTLPPAALSLLCCFLALPLLCCFLALPGEWAGSAVPLPQACSENNCSMNCKKHQTDQNLIAMTCYLLSHLACLILQLRALRVGTTCQIACLFLLLLLLLCPGLDLCHLWCLCLGGILQQWRKRVLTHWGRVMQICVFNTRLFSLHNTLNYAIHRACLRMVRVTDVYRNLTSLWINL